MRILKFLALIAVLATGHAAGPALATPVGAGALPSVVGETRADNALIAEAWHRGRPHRAGRSYDGRRFYRGPRVVYRPAFRPRVVCRTRIRVLATRYGYVQRPVQVCRRRF